MVGFFNQTVEIGTLIETDASSMFVAASKSFALATVYAGYAMEDSETDIAYTYSGDDSKVAFTVEGSQESRFTVGATLNVLAKLNLEMGHGDLTTYTAGLMFGF
jgi:predicted nucleotidyltransferase